MAMATKSAEEDENPQMNNLMASKHVDGSSSGKNLNNGHVLG
jgi:hypothetical protein